MEILFSEWIISLKYKVNFLTAKTIIETFFIEDRVTSVTPLKKLKEVKINAYFKTTYKGGCQ